MSAANECIPYYDAGEDITARAEAAVVGKRFVKISDPQDGPAGMGLSTTSEGSNIVVSHCGAAEQAIGVSSYDAAQDGKLYVIRGKVVPVKAGAAITAGDIVASGAAGVAIPFVFDEATDKRPLGVAVDSAADTADCPVALFI